MCFSLSLYRANPRTYPLRRVLSILMSGKTSRPPRVSYCCHLRHAWVADLRHIHTADLRHQPSPKYAFLLFVYLTLQWSQYEVWRKDDNSNVSKGSIALFQKESFFPTPVWWNLQICYLNLPLMDMMCMGLLYEQRLTKPAFGLGHGKGK